MKPVSKTLKSAFDSLTNDEYHAIMEDDCIDQECKVHNPFIKCPCCKKTFRYKWVEINGKYKRIAEIK